MSNRFKLTVFLFLLINYGCFNERVFEISNKFSIYNSDSCDCVCLGQSFESDYHILVRDVKRVKGNQNRFIVYVYDGNQNISYLIKDDKEYFNKGDEIRLSSFELREFFNKETVDFDKEF